MKDIEAMKQTYLEALKSGNAGLAQDTYKNEGKFIKVKIPGQQGFASMTPLQSVITNDEDFRIKVAEAINEGEKRVQSKPVELEDFSYLKVELERYCNFDVKALQAQLKATVPDKKLGRPEQPAVVPLSPTRPNPAKLDAVGLSSVLESRTQSKRSTDEDVGLRGNITAVQEELLKQDIERRIAQSSQMQKKMAALERTNTGPQLRRSPEQVNLFENEAVNPTSSEETKAASTPVLSKGKSKEGEVARDVNKEYAKALNELGQAYKDKDETVLNDKKIDSHLKEIAKLIKLGADINSVDANRENIFHHIARIGTSSQFLQEAYPAIFQAEQVVRGKSEFNRKNAEGKTILDVAYENNNYGTMVTLISAAPKDQKKELKPKATDISREEKKELKPEATDISREEKGKEKEQMQQKGVKFDEQLQTSREAELKKEAVHLKSALKKTEHHWAQEVKANSSSTTSRER
jgi:ankyrin repeat protein